MCQDCAWRVTAADATAVCLQQAGRLASCSETGVRDGWTGWAGRLRDGWDVVDSMQQDVSRPTRRDVRR